MTNIRTAMNRGAFDFVTKPIDFADLETTIAKTLRHIEFLRDARQRQAASRARLMPRCRAISRPTSRSVSAATQARSSSSGQRREIATLFTDVAGFTALARNAGAGALGSFSTNISPA